MLGFVDGDVLICKGRLTDLENVPFLKLILTDNLDRLSRLLACCGSILMNTG